MNDMPQREQFRYDAVRLDGTRETLVDTMALYENHSAVNMYHTYPEADGTEQSDFVQDRLLRQLLDGLASGEEGCRIVLLLLWRMLLRKVRPLRILWAGGRAHAWDGALLEALHAFHAETRIWRLNGAAAGGAWPPVRMAWDALLLPEQAMDVLIVEDVSAHVPVRAAEALFRTVKPYGTVLVLSEDAAWQEAVHAGSAEAEDDTKRIERSCHAYRAGVHVVTRATVTPAAAAALHAATPSGAAEALSAAIRERLQIITPLMEEGAPVTCADAETIAETARQVEQAIAALYPELHSVSIKYHANEWKRTLIDYALGFGAWDDVPAAFAALAEDARAEICLR